MSGRYFGSFDNRDSIIAEFFRGEDYDYEKHEYKRIQVPEDFPTDEEILLADYDTPPYEGYARVLFLRGGKLFEVCGSHCSCYGLEGQWAPEETSWEALALPFRRGKLGYEGTSEATAALRELVLSNVAIEG